MAVRSRLLAAGSSIQALGHRDVYTVPSGRTAVIRFWRATNRAGGALTVVWGVRSGGVNPSFDYASALADGASMGSVSGDLVLGPGESLTLYASGAQGTNPAVHYVVAGSLLEGAPA